jgi:hypothetical protein
MTTLIAIYDSDGCVGRCDAKCYNATGPECDCICGGKNHGAGRQQASQNTQSMAQKMIADYTEKIGLTNFSAEINQEMINQLALF